ncbi:hypothetical protein NPIL_194171 [Nephila pilipes]|uniref:Uncharacterized protein n=1 Tax=Nephila pilipes TaxID=299642 RepID=A0A8X6MT04_NEPPI|nr:hypothetical protein NPIL_194171 [Nephila pilipes]
MLQNHNVEFGVDNLPFRDKFSVGHIVAVENGNQEYLVSRFLQLTLFERGEAGEHYSIACRFDFESYWYQKVSTHVTMVCRKVGYWLLVSTTIISSSVHEFLSTCWLINAAKKGNRS